MDDNEPQLSGFVRGDVLQRFTARRRMRARLNIRAAKMADPVEAWVHGLDQLVGSSSGGPIFDDFDDGGAIHILKTTLGNWSSDGEDTAPVTGMWLYLERIEATESVDVPAGGEDGTDEFDTEEEFTAEDVTSVHWEISLWEDGTQDTDFEWHSETLELALAEDIFMFRDWSPVPDLTEADWEDEAEETDSTVWLEPIEPPPSGIPIENVTGLPAALLLRPEIVSVSTITDASMTALGFDTQLELTDGMDTWFVPCATSAWT